MFIDLRTPGVRLPRGRAHSVLARVRNAFHCVSDQVVRVLVRVTPAAGARGEPLRDCAIEVHLRNGDVQVVHERQRRLGGVLGRALQRAWTATSRRLGGAPDGQPQRPLQEPLQARLLPLAQVSRHG